ncbi:MAG TPA: DUF692 domain-containing protein [Methylophilaceae bacterium]|jgi:hypothetical protein
MAQLSEIRGAGLGLKRELIAQLQAESGKDSIGAISFLEIAPENWIGAGGRIGKQLAWLTERYPIVAHGLCLSLGAPDALNEVFIQRVKEFLDQYRIPLYTEHLSYGSDGGYLYDLLPIPFTEEAVYYVAKRIRRTQDILGRRIAVENASYYLAAPISEMDELTFLRAVLEEADCWLHLDVNNIYVNSVNFGFDPHEFLRGIPGERIVYAHIAGHDQEAPDLIIDTHGQDVIDPVWGLLDEAYRLFGTFPTLLERDINIPPLSKLMQEVNRIAEMQASYMPNHRYANAR